MTTLRPPYRGSVRVNPSSGLLGTTFTLTLISWKSDYKPIKYRVWSTEEVRTGEYQILELFKEEWTESTSDFKTKLKNSNPLSVEIKDESGEVVYKTVKIKVMDSDDFNRFLASVDDREEEEND